MFETTMRDFRTMWIFLFKTALELFSSFFSHTWRLFLRLPTDGVSKIFHYKFFLLPNAAEWSEKWDDMSLLWFKPSCAILGLLKDALPTALQHSGWLLFSGFAQTFGPKTRMMVTEVPSWVRRKPRKYFVSGPTWGKRIRLEELN